MKMFEPEAQSRIRLRKLEHLKRQREYIIELASKYWQVGQEYQATADTLKNWEIQHPEIAFPSIGHMTKHIFLILVLPGVYLFDYIVFHGAAEYLALLVFAPGSWTIKAAVILIPLAFLLLEITISNQRCTAEEEAVEYQVGTPRKSIWFWLAILTVLVMPILFVATFVAAHAALLATNSAFILLLVGLTILCFILHASVLFGGRSAQEAKEHFIGRSKYRQLQRQLRSLKAKVAQLSRTLINAFSAYQHSLNSFNQTYPEHRIALGPFDAVTRELINQLFGYDIIQTPNGVNSHQHSNLIDLRSSRRNEPPTKEQQWLP
ncbi:MAG TPA: hypothetical protein VK203_21835 [Nostocaceae cyanobacterium]|nr:hypothetical protein [Kamptonema sp.]HLO87627.1 hypothetical protein [Nostocaceae cyanobacterium]